VDVLITTTVSRAALVDLDATLFLQAALFLCLYVVLRYGFFRPYVRLLRRRDEATRGQRERAEALLRQSRELGESIDRRLADARAEAVKARRALAEEGARLRDEIVTRERARMQARLDEEVRSLEGQRAAFLAQLDRVSSELTGLIEGQVQALDGRRP
jgi:F0F1-type ATP synthase membrane subunit b/b'